MLHGVVDAVVLEHVQQAAFLWAQRVELGKAHPPQPDAIASVEARLLANLDAIVIAGPAAWPFVLAQFRDFPEPGEMFVAGCLAMAFADDARLAECRTMADEHPDSRSGLAGALAWFALEKSWPTVWRMLGSESEVQRAVALDVVAAHGRDLGERLATFLADPSPMVRRSACGLAAASGRRDCAAAIAAQAADPDPELCFAAASALTRLDRADAATAPLGALVERAGARAPEALRLLAEISDPAPFRDYLGRLFASDQTRLLAIRGVGMTAEKGYLPWLLDQMATPETAAAAGASFLELYPDAADVPGLFSDAPGDFDPDLAAVVDETGDLYPVAARIREWAAQG